MNWKYFLKLVGISFASALGMAASFIIYLMLDSIGILNGYDNYVLQEGLIEVLHSKQPKTPLKKLTRFDWEEVCIYPPDPYLGCVTDFTNRAAGKWRMIFTSRGIEKAIYINDTIPLNSSYIEAEKQCFPGNISVVLHVEKIDHNNRKFLSFEKDNALANNARHLEVVSEELRQ